MEIPTFVKSVVGWLRAGYPEGLPIHDYVPLFALLRRRLSDDEVAQVAAELIREGDVRTGTAMQEAILAVTREMPREEDMERVSDRLSEVGWPGKLFDTDAPPHPVPGGSPRDEPRDGTAPQGPPTDGMPPRDEPGSEGSPTA
jgi:hypothetical protein